MSASDLMDLARTMGVRDRAKDGDARDDDAGRRHFLFTFSLQGSLQHA
jgi:hypothetical protein